MSEENDTNPSTEPTDAEVNTDDQSESSRSSDANSGGSDGDASLLPPPVAASETPVAPSSDNKSRGKGRAIAIGAIIMVAVLLVGFLVVGGGSSGSSTVEYEYFAADEDGEIFFASLKDDRVVVSTRLGESVKTITHLESLSSLATQEMLVVPSSDSYYVWTEDEVSEIDKKTLTSMSVYRGEDIDNVMYIADAKTLLVNDESNCFAIPVGKQSTRIASGDCQIVGGRIFSVDTSSTDAVLTEVDLKGELINRFTLAIGSGISIHKSGQMISGISSASDGGFEVYSTSDGKRMYAAQSGETVTVLDESLNSSDYLVSVENEADDETLDVGVLEFADGSGLIKKLASVYSAQGWISPDGAKALLLTQTAVEGTKRDLNLWDVDAATSQSVVTGIEELHDYASDNQQRVALLTNRELIVGAFDNSFASRTSGNFDGGSVFFHSNGILARIGVDGKYDLVYVKNGPADDSGNKTVTLTTAADAVGVYESSLVVDGYVYYTEESNDYLEVYRQKLDGEATRERVAEGRISRLTVLPNGQLFYSEKDGDRIVSYVQKNEKPESRVQVSDRYEYHPRPTSFDPAALYFSGVQYRSFAYAQIDADAKRCRDLDAPFVNTGTTAEFTLTRVNNSSYSMEPADYQVFCVRNASVISVIEANRADGDNSQMRWVGINCYDSEGSDTSDRSNLNSGDVTVYVQSGVVICEMHDWNDYYSDYDYDLDEYVDPVRGMTVTLSVQ